MRALRGGARAPPQGRRHRQGHAGRRRAGRPANPRWARPARPDRTEATGRRLFGFGPADDDRRCAGAVRIADRPRRFVRPQRLANELRRARDAQQRTPFGAGQIGFGHRAGLAAVAAINRADARFSTGCQVSPRARRAPRIPAPSPAGCHPTRPGVVAAQPTRLPPRRPPSVGTDRQRRRLRTRADAEGVDVAAQQRALEAT